jgi:hypothetical protein
LELTPGVTSGSGAVKRTLSLQPKGRSQPQEEGSNQEQQKLAPLAAGVWLCWHVEAFAHTADRTINTTCQVA